MAIVRDGQAPYAPTESVMAVIHGYRSKHPHTPFTVENIQPLGVSHSIAPRTLLALKVLDLVDDEGNPTPSMDVLREASNAEFAARLAEVVQAAYAEVFSYKDPATDSPEAMDEVFRFYKPPSMQPRMVRLFYGLCVHAGLIESAPAIGKSGKTSGRKAPSPKRGTTKAGPPKPPPFVPPPPAPSTKKPQLIAALLEEFPAEGQPMTAEDAEWVINMLKLAMPKAYGFDPPNGWSQ